MWSTLRSMLRSFSFEVDPTKRRLRDAANIDDLRAISRRVLPRGVFDFIEGGAEDETTLSANRAAYSKWRFEPRVLRDVSRLDASSTLLGQSVSMPLVLAPVGSTGIVDPIQAETAVARSAGRVGIPYALSTFSSRSIEEVAAASDGSKWFQLYMLRDRGLVRELIERASAAGYGAIMPTVDAAFLGRRERDIRRGFTLPLQLGPGTVVDGLLHPGWTRRFLKSEPPSFANFATSTDRAGGAGELLTSSHATQFDASFSWADLEWIRSVWRGPIVLKGIQTVSDAVIAADEGVEAIALSNHGGRQLDGSPGIMEIVAPVADAVTGRTEIICDGGVWRGSDVVKALALGATACMVGRAYVYGLAAAGEAGVDHVLSFFDDGIRRTMALIGVSSVQDLDGECLAEA